MVFEKKGWVLNAFLLFIFLVAINFISATTFVINNETTYQTIDGFGGQVFIAASFSNWSGYPMSDVFYDLKNRIGFNHIFERERYDCRSANPSQTCIIPSEGATVEDIMDRWGAIVVINDAGGTMKHSDDVGETLMSRYKLIKDNGLDLYLKGFYLASWMNLSSGANRFDGEAQSYRDITNWFIGAYRVANETYNFTFDALSVQNEPDLVDFGQFNDSTLNLTETVVYRNLSSLGFNPVLIGVDASRTTALADNFPNTASNSLSSILSYHVYDGGSNPCNDATYRNASECGVSGASAIGTYGKPYWMTEFVPTSKAGFNTSEWNYGMFRALHIQKLFTRSNTSSYTDWTFNFLIPNQSSEIDYVPSIYPYFHFARFTTGYTRINQSIYNTSTVFVSSYQKGNNVSIVLVNDDSNPATINLVLSSVFNITNMSRYQTRSALSDKRLTESMNKTTDVLFNETFGTEITLPAYGINTLVYLEESEILPPQVEINSPLNTTYTSGSILFNVTTDVDSSVKFSVDSGVTNYTMDTLDSRNFNYTLSLSNGSYTAIFYANVSSIFNSTESVSFSINTTEDETPTPSPGGGRISIDDLPSSKRIHSFSFLEAFEKGFISGFEKSSPLDSVEVYVNKNSTSVKFEFYGYEFKPSEKMKDLENVVYKYFLVKTFNLDYLDMAKVRVKVEKSWLDEKKISSDDLFVFRYSDEDSSWEEYFLDFDGEDSDFVYYVFETNRFSYFAIAEKSFGLEIDKDYDSEEAREKFDFLFFLVLLFLVLGLIGFLVWKKLNR